jgi:rhodanese-related sulfurtransferase
VLIRMNTNDTKRRLIDVRERWEFASGHIEDSELVPLRSLPAACDTWDRKEPLTIVCRSGARAESARAQLARKGFQDVVVLPGGVQQWRREGKPLAQAEAIPGVPGSTWAIYASALVVALALARFVSPWFLVLAGFFSVRLIRAWTMRPRQTTTQRPKTTS